MTLPKLNDGPVSSGEQSLTPVPLVVLDTNAVLDWLLFGDPGMEALSHVIVDGRVRWIATASMRDEFFHVLGRPWAAARGADSVRLAATWAQYCDERPQPPLAARRLSCTDPADQMFLDLALAAGAKWLVSHDRALLKVRRRAALLGLVIAPPEQWRVQ